MAGPQQKREQLKRRTMVKDVVGKCRATTYDIPEDGFIYGIQNEVQVVGAGTVLSSWDVSKASKSETTMQSFPATNREALTKGCLTSKSQREYAKDHPVMKSKIVSPQKKQTPLPPNSFSYGIASTQNTIPMGLIMSAPDDGEERTYPDVSGVIKKGKLPMPRPTKSSKLASGAAQKILNTVEAVPEFKMARFKNVKAKVQMGR
ncbi:hypothetical protein ScalyP_jg3952 [Parmales sp. scaly parma]|nr:hypothetical protein ScalyP_jg3952 [Parmales sp. scaly parma]